MNKTIKTLRGYADNETINMLPIFFIGIFILLLACELLLKKDLTLIIALMIILDGFTFVTFCFKNKKYAIMFMVSLAIAVAGMFDGMIIGLLGANSIKFCILICLVILGAMGIFLALPIQKDLKNKIYDFDILSSEKKVVDKRNPGDAQIGINSETKIPVIIPEKDRYVHMAVFGPTGSGKTSQVLTPMIYNDIKDNKMSVICLEPKGDFADKVFALAKLEGRDPVFFDPTLDNCPYFNPLKGNIEDVIENVVTTFKAFDKDSSAYFQTLNETLLRRGLSVVKKLEQLGAVDALTNKQEATLLDLETVFYNIGGNGIKMVGRYRQLPFKNSVEQEEAKSISEWFLNDYYTALGDDKRNATKTYEQSSGIRNQLSKLNSNAYLKRVLNPPAGKVLRKGDYIDFDDLLLNGGILSMTSAQGKLRDMSRFLGYFLILQLQSAVFRRPGTEKTRRGCALYIDEFQTYANDSFGDMLTQGRSYRVSCILATQNRALIGANSGKNGKAFIDLVSTNARNVILFPGCNKEDAAYYSEQFGEDLVVTENVSINRKKANIFNAFSGGLFEERETLSTKEEWKKRFRATDLIYQDFTWVVCSIIQHNTLQRPCRANIQFIPYDVNEQVEKFLEGYRETHLIKDISELIAQDERRQYGVDHAEIFDLEDDENDSRGINNNGMDFSDVKPPKTTSPTTSTPSYEDVEDDDDESGYGV